jgi:hypothetical protein
MNKQIVNKELNIRMSSIVVLCDVVISIDAFVGVRDMEKVKYSSFWMISKMIIVIDINAENKSMYLILR